jgi:hypothetical protein
MSIIGERNLSFYILNISLNRIGSKYKKCLLTMHTDLLNRKLAMSWYIGKLYQQLN